MVLEPSLVILVARGQLRLLENQLGCVFRQIRRIAVLPEDSFDDDADNSLRGRCYGTNVGQVIELAGAFNDALRGEATMPNP